MKFTFLCIAALWVSLSSFAAELWISDRDSLNSYQTGRIKGSGTSSSPFYGDFDTITRTRVTTNDVVHLLAGKFYARAVEDQTDFESHRSIECLAPGVKLSGAGRTATTIFLHSHPPKSAVMFYASGDAIELRDLTIDCDSWGTESWKRDGLVLAGSDCIVERVGIKHVYGIAALDMEAWAIFAGNPETGRAPGRNNRVLACVAEDFLGDYLNGISSCGSGGLIRDCTIILPDISIRSDGSFRAGHFAGLNLSRHTDLRVENNTVLNGRDAIYSEGDNLDHATISANVLRGAWNGVRIAAFAPVRDLTFENNLIVLNGSTGGPAGFALDASRAGVILDNLEFRGNTVRRAFPRPGSENPNLLHPLVIENPELGRIRNVRWLDNRTGNGSVFKGCETAVRFSGNRGTDGEPMN